MIDVLVSKMRILDWQVSRLSRLIKFNDTTKKISILLIFFLSVEKHNLTAVKYKRVY